MNNQNPNDEKLKNVLTAILIVTAVALLFISSKIDDTEPTRDVEADQLEAFYDYHESLGQNIVRD